MMDPSSTATTETQPKQSSNNFILAPAQLSGTAPDQSKLPDSLAKALAQDFPHPPKFEDKYEEREYQKGRLALAFRIFGKHGFDEGIAGHITLRDPVDPTTFWVNPLGVPFSFIKASDLIQVSHDGNVIAGGPCRLLNTAAFMIHSAIHSARPDVVCAAHSHSLYGKAFCALGVPLDIITQDSCTFYDDHVVYEQFNGVVLAEEEGRAIARALGGKKAALLRNHGFLTVAPTVEAAVFWFCSLEKCAHAQLLADAAARGRGRETVKIDEESAAFTHLVGGTPWAGWYNARPAFEVMAREAGEEVYQ